MLSRKPKLRPGKPLHKTTKHTIKRLKEARSQRWQRTLTNVGAVEVATMPAYLSSKPLGKLIAILLSTIAVASIGPITYKKMSKKVKEKTFMVGYELHKESH